MLICKSKTNLGKVRIIFSDSMAVDGLDEGLLAFNCSNRHLLTHRWHLVTSILVSSLKVRQDRRIYKNPNPFSFFVLARTGRRIRVPQGNQA
jgi:hypothetical protein